MHHVSLSGDQEGATIVLAEDDRSVRDALDRALRLENYHVTAVGDGQAAIDAVKQAEPAVIVLDVMMPNVDGLTACRRLRQLGFDTPILMLTARHELGDRVAGLDAGADDYLVKPFELDELLARLRALLRRRSSDDHSTRTQIADLEIDTGARLARRNGVSIELTKTEFDLLVLLVENANLVLEREVIYERIWGYDFETNSKSLDVYIGYLRRKTEGDNGELGPRLIHTVRGVGYTVREKSTTGHGHGR